MRPLPRHADPDRRTVDQRCPDRLPPSAVATTSSSTVDFCQIQHTDTDGHSKSTPHTQAIAWHRSRVQRWRKCHDKRQRRIPDRRPANQELLLCGRSPFPGPTLYANRFTCSSRENFHATCDKHRAFQTAHQSRRSASPHRFPSRMLGPLLRRLSFVSRRLNEEAAGFDPRRCELTSLPPSPRHHIS
jgi:hypothetical protein